MRNRKVKQATVMCIIGFLLLSFFKVLSSLYIINLTPSMDIGVYKKADNQIIKKGDLIAFSPPQNMLYQTLRYLPQQENKVLIKEIAGLEGDHVCRVSRTVFINNKEKVKILLNDSKGRSLESANLCRKLGPNEVYVIQDGKKAYDSRYFGPFDRSLVNGKVKPFWIW